MTTPTMRAVLLDSYETSAFNLSAVARPTPTANEVLVRVGASGVNPIDYKIRKGRSPYAMPDLPAVLGTDMAGIIEHVGPNVQDFRVGDEVYGLTGGVKRLQGSLAEYQAADPALLAKKPSSLSIREAAALPLVVLTAWEGLVDRAKIQAGQKLLVHGGAGGVGHMAIQIAVARGLEVFATTSAGKMDVVRALGATPIDYNATSSAEYVVAHTGGFGFDVIYDTVGGEAFESSFSSIRHYGHIVSCAAFGTHNLAAASLRCATISGIFVLLPMLSGQLRARHGKILSEVARLVDAGSIRPIVDPRRFTLETAQAAHDAVEDGSARTKIVIDVS